MTNPTADRRGEGFAFFTWYRLTRPTKPWLANPKSELFFWRHGAR